MSIRRACAALEFDRSTHHYRSCRPDQAPLAARIRTICETRVRYGYRRVQVLLRREGWMINQKRTRRIYNELGLQLRNKTPKRRVKAKLRENRAPATRPNDVWAMDFVHDQLATGRKIRVLTVVDIFSRFSPAVDPRFSYRAEHLVATLERGCAKMGYPRTIRVDLGSEFIFRDLDLWAYAKGHAGLLPARQAHRHGCCRKALSRRCWRYFFRTGPSARLASPSRGEIGVCFLGLLDAHPLGGPLLRDVIIIGRTTLGVLGR